MGVHKLSNLSVGPSIFSSIGTTKCCCKSSLLQMQAQQMKTLQFTRQFRTSSREIERTGARVNQEFSVKPNQETVLSVDKNNLAITEEVISKINSQISNTMHGRLFAVIHIGGKQVRVTDGDLVMVEGVSPTNVGDIIRLEKVLLVGSKDFTLLGRPILRPDLVRIEATVVEKSLTHTKTHFKKSGRKEYMRINFFRHHFSILRINCVSLEGLLDECPETEGIDGRVF